MSIREAFILLTMTGLFYSLWSLSGSWTRFRVREALQLNGALLVVARGDCRRDLLIAGAFVMFTTVNLSPYLPVERLVWSTIQQLAYIMAFTLMVLTVMFGRMTVQALGRLPKR